MEEQGIVTEQQPLPELAGASGGGEPGGEPEGAAMDVDAAGAGLAADGRAGVGAAALGDSGPASGNVADPADHAGAVGLQRSAISGMMVEVGDPYRPSPPQPPKLVVVQQPRQQKVSRLPASAAWPAPTFSSFPDF